MLNRINNIMFVVKNMPKFVSAYKAALRSLYISEEEYRELLTFSSIGLMLTDLEKVQKHNHAILKSVADDKGYIKRMTKAVRKQIWQHLKNGHDIKDCYVDIKNRNYFELNCRVR